MDLNIDENFELVIEDGSASVLGTYSVSAVLKNMILKEEIFFNKAYFKENIYNIRLYDGMDAIQTSKEIQKKLLEYYKDTYADFEVVSYLGVDIIISEEIAYVYYKNTYDSELVFTEEFSRRL